MPKLKWSVTLDHQLTSGELVTFLTGVSQPSDAVRVRSWFGRIRSLRVIHTPESQDVFVPEPEETLEGVQVLSVDGSLSPVDFSQPFGYAPRATVLTDRKLMDKNSAIKPT